MQTDLACVAKDRLDGVLQQFYADLVEKDGKEYEPESLKVMIAAIDMCFKEKCGYSILKDKELELSRTVLNWKSNRIAKKWPRKSDPFTAPEELLWEHILGNDNPTSLNSSISFLVSQHFGTRGCQEHHHLRIEDLKETQGPVI